MRHPSAFTLIEMLVSLAITLIMMAAVVTLFQNVTDSVSGSRAIIETSERLRAARNRLQSDLIGATASMTPPLRPENDEGYFEYIEGGFIDRDWASSTITSTVLGDTDDILMFTVRSRGEPFVGKFNTNGTIESQVAEVMYFAVPNGPIIDATTDPPTRLYTLYRRVLLVVPGIGPQAIATDFYDRNDVSVRIQYDTPATLAPNTLGDLTKRENRFGHYDTMASGVGIPLFPYNVNAIHHPTSPMNRPNSNEYLVPLIKNTGAGIDRTGDDVILTNVLAFDVQAYDPNAPVQVPSVAVTPTDLGFTPAPSTATTRAYGAYVDIGYAPYTGAVVPPSGAPRPLFFFGGENGDIAPGTTTRPLTPIMPLQKSKDLYNPTTYAAYAYASGTLQAPNTSPPPVAFTFDTWSLHYENDGTGDDGTNGLDDNNDGVVDDALEFDTQPPFAAPLRGIRVIIRAYEPSSQQVREVTVVQDFLPE